MTQRLGGMARQGFTAAVAGAFLLVGCGTSSGGTADSTGPGDAPPASTKSSVTSTTKPPPTTTSVLGTASGVVDARGEDLDVKLELLGYVQKANTGGECAKANLKPGSTVAVAKVTFTNPNKFDWSVQGVFGVSGKGRWSSNDGDFHYYNPETCALPQLAAWNQDLTVVNPSRPEFLLVQPGKSKSRVTGIVIEPDRVGDASGIRQGSAVVKFPS